MELRHLRYFVAVAEAGHITRAAAELGIQQPPLSQQIKALEGELGTALFHRHPKGVTLTDSGRLFLAEARRILQDMAAMEQRMLRVASGMRGLLAVAFTTSAAAHGFTPKALRAFRSRYPEIALVLNENNAAEITDGVVSGRLHCGFLRVPVSRPAGVALRTLLTEPVVVAVPLDHRLGRRSRAVDHPGVPLKEFHGENLILVRRPGAPGLYANLLSLCDESGVRPNVVAEVERMITALNLVAAGAGISVVPASMKEVHSRAVVYRPLARSVRLNAPLTLAYRAADEVGATATFVELVTTLAANTSSLS
ncbi:MAG TPA: LysR family transcriptional regulator [Burkholderiales bacterium]|nr:LysR family transcriptional regulator [Burkholderiales bacterium]